jgi:hypothetical protein
MNLATLSFAAMLGRRNAIKFGAKVVRHGRYVAFQMAAAAVPRYLFAGTPRLIAEPRPPRQPQRRQVFDPQEFAQTPWERYVFDANKIANVRRATHRSHPVSGCIAARDLPCQNPSNAAISPSTRPSSVGRAAAGAAGQALNLVPRRGG